MRISHQEEVKHFLGTFWQKLCSSIPLHPPATLRVTRVVFRTPGTCLEIWGHHDAILPLLPERASHVGEVTTRLSVPLRAFVPSLSQHRSHLGGAGGADILGKLDH